jgi:hypothetical protein
MMAGCSEEKKRCRKEKKRKKKRREKKEKKGKEKRKKEEERREEEGRAGRMERIPAKGRGKSRTGGEESSFIFEFKFIYKKSKRKELK